VLLGVVKAALTGNTSAREFFDSIRIVARSVRAL